MSGPRRGNQIMTTAGRSLPWKANEPARSRQEAPAHSNDHNEIGDLDVRHHTHAYPIVPCDTPEGGVSR